MPNRTSGTRPPCAIHSAGGRDTVHNPEPEPLPSAGRSVTVRQVEFRSNREAGMADNTEQEILDRIEIPGWTTTRAVLQDGLDDAPKAAYERIENVMRVMAREGKVCLWRLVYDEGKGELLAAAKTDLDLDKELRERGAWATAERVPVES